MKYNKSLIIICLIYIFYGCEKSDIVKFDVSEKLEEIPLPEIELLGRSVRLTAIDTFLVVQKDNESFIQIYSTNTHSLLAEFGVKGRGPEEFIRPSLMKQTSYAEQNGSPEVYVYDFQRKTISKINIFNALRGNYYEYQKSITSNTHLPALYYIDDDIYVAEPDSKNRFVISGSSKDQDILIPYLPELEISIPPSDIGIVYASNATAVNKERNMLVSAPSFLGELDFFDLEGNLIRVSLLESRDKFKDELIQGYSAFNQIKYNILSLDTKGEMIYCLNLDTSVEDYSNGKYYPKLQVFSWDGKAVKEYILGNRPITDVAVDTVKNRIYAFNKKDELTPLSYYQMK